ncbi:MAG: carboxypeptidase regulatory-like domain-containing protein [Planctomycetes bacterium]|nr:carboxypeptidase regulatory-like domain-containing protein [Planctomycetota bacterium]
MTTLRLVYMLGLCLAACAPPNGGGMSVAAEPVPIVEPVLDQSDPFGRVVTGQVTDVVTAQPIGDVRVRAVLADVAKDDGLHEAITANDGRYRIEGVPPGALLVVAHHPDYFMGEGAGGAEPMTILLGDQDQPPKPVAGLVRDTRDLRLTRGVTLKARVIDAAGLPVGGAEVAWICVEESRSLDASLRAESRRTTTDADGAFAFRGVRPLPGVTVGARKKAVGGEARVELDLRPDHPGDREVEIRLSEAGGLDLSCLLPDGKPAADLVLWVRDAFQGRLDPFEDAKRPSPRVVTDDQGRCRIDDLPVGPLTLFLRDPELRIHEAQSRPILKSGETTKVVLRLEAMPAAPRKPK